MPIAPLALEDLADVLGGQAATPTQPPSNYPTPQAPSLSTPFKPFDTRAVQQYGGAQNSAPIGGGPKLSPFARDPELLS